MFPETANWLTSADEYVHEFYISGNPLTRSLFIRIIHVGINAVI